MRNKILPVLVLTILIISSADASAFWDFGKFVDGIKQKLGHEHERPAKVVIIEHSETPKDEPIIIEPPVQQQARVTKKFNLANKAWLFGATLLHGKDTECEQWNGTWYWEADKIGCDGVDATWGCNQSIVRFAKNKCEAYKAEFVCGHEGIYCAYS